jgi:Ca-activated chloride channel family protein
MLLAGAAHAGEQDAFALYREGKYEAAAEAFAQKDMENPKEPRWRYNRGVAQMRAGDTEAALAAFSSVLARAKDKKLSFASAFNAGNAAFAGQQYSLAAGYFRQALAARPDDTDAKANLALALWHEKHQEQGQEDDQQGEQQACQDDKDSQPGRDKEQGQDSQPGGDKEQGQDGQPGREGQADEQAQDSSGRDGEARQEAMPGEDGGQGQQDPADEGQNQQDADLPGTLATVDQPEEGLPSPARHSEEKPGERMEQNMASALLDNVAEDPGLMFWRMRQVSPHAAPSGRTW